MMPSPFDPIQQENSLEAKITFALERISLVFKTMLQEESKQSKLSPIQLQILVFLLYHTPEQCKVSYLAVEFGLTKATVSDSVKVLLEKNLVKKLGDPKDTRSFFIALTESGKTEAEMASRFSLPIERILTQYNLEDKRLFFSILTNTIRDLQKNGLIPMQRMCFNCNHYQNKDGMHYCLLLQKVLEDTDIRLDCKEHETV